MTEDASLVGAAGMAASSTTSSCATCGHSQAMHSVRVQLVASPESFAAGWKEPQCSCGCKEFVRR